tara:strand:- start:3374 stop:3601 length:228 start_codon:yes stop_codon:yes gene_type:complete
MSRQVDPETQSFTFEHALEDEVTFSWNHLTQSAFWEGESKFGELCPEAGVGYSTEEVEFHIKGGYWIVDEVEVRV